MLGTVQNYAWGSTTAIPDLLGQDPDGRPQAELWFGDHRRGPASVLRDGELVPLDDVIAADPVHALGPGGGSSLPFLAKVLAATRPLSIQAHPDRAQAVAGYDREEAAGVPLDAGHRSFRDRGHKPELLCALTPFEALCGFRAVDEIVALLDAFALAALMPLRALLVGSGSDEQRLRAALQWLLDLASDEVDAIVHGIIQSEAGPSITLDLVRALGAEYPGDPGVVVALLLNHLHLDPGQAIFLGAGNLHTYLAGTAVEVMANSDNVVRGGLTSKHVDRATLLDIVDTRPLDAPVQHPAGSVHRYDVPVPEFSLTRIAHVEHHDLDLPGPAVAVVTEGSVVCRTGSGTLSLATGEAVWIPAAERRLGVAAQHGCLHLASVGS